MNIPLVAKRKGSHSLVAGIILAAASLVWMFYLSDAFILPYLKINWLSWFKVRWFEDTDWRLFPIFVASSIGPFLFLGVATGIS